jgi:alanine-glyoxylate transaminase/serine-glyoxylate transaminase/serine-pyruvate transaminase
MDLGLVLPYWEGGTRTYHHTAPINPLYGLHEALVMLAEEGLEASWARHAANHAALVDGVEALGLAMLVDQAHRLPQLNLVCVPDGVDDAWVRREALARYSLELGNGLGALAGKVWRIGLMGTASTPANVALCLDVLATLIPEARAAG